MLVTLALVIVLAVGCSPNPEPLAPAAVDPEAGGYAGLSLDLDDQSIVYIYMVYPSQERAEYLAKAHLDGFGWKATREVRAVKVKYSKIELDNWKEAFWNEERTGKFPSVSGGGARVNENRNYIGVFCGAELEQTERSVREWLLSVGIPQDAFTFEVSTMATAAMLPEPPYDYDCLPAEVFDPVTGLSWPGFGGFWYERNRINVYLLNPSQELAEQMVLAFHGRESVKEYGDVRAMRGQYTWEQLQRWYHQTRLTPQFPGWIGACEVDNKRNRIALDVSGGIDERMEKQVEAVLSNLGIPREAVYFDKAGCWGY